MENRNPDSIPTPQRLVSGSGDHRLQPLPATESLMFVPKKLEIEGMPLLRCLPVNVMFASYVYGPGRRTVASSLYIYDLATLEISPEKISMVYRNDQIPSNSWLRIEYNRKTASYYGEKWVQDKMSHSTVGAAWDGFFHHLTLLGLRPGEACIFEPHLKIPSRA